MALSNLLSAGLVVVLSVLLLFGNQNFAPDEYFVKQDGLVWLPESTNAGGHVYPYMATIVSMTCLLSIVLLIICYGSQFGGS